jgi:hypothetical protein
MEPILVPGPPKEAFRKLRPISDLIRSQVNHFKHLEAKLPAEVRTNLPQHVIVTEDDAARYIVAMTGFLRSRIAEAPAPSVAPTPVRPITQIAPAAAASAGIGKPGAKRRSSVGKKVSSRKSKARPGSPREKQ